MNVLSLFDGMSCGEDNLIIAASRGRACEDGVTRQHLEPRKDGKPNLSH